jgi:hypothetical protein
MGVTIQDFANHYREIVEIFKKENVAKVMLFKSLAEIERYDLSILITEYDKDKQYDPDCIHNLARCLEEILNCSVFITDLRWMDSGYCEQLDQSNLMELPLDIIDNHIIISSLQSFFGSQWEFKKRESRSIPDDTGYEKYEVEMQEWKQQTLVEAEPDKTKGCHLRSFFSRSEVSANLNISLSYPDGTVINKNLLLSEVPPPDKLGQDFTDKLGLVISDLLRQHGLVIVPEHSGGW